MILAGELAPGCQLRENDLAAQLGVSRTPIREALRRLVEYGVVESAPNRGAVVRRFGHEEVAYIQQIREALEGMAAELASGRLTAADFDRLDAWADAARDESSPGYFAAFEEFDVGLHQLVAARSGNPILARDICKLLDTMILVHDQLERILIGVGQIESDIPKEIRRESTRQHLEIVSALKSGDAVASRKAMVEHVRASCAMKVCLLAEIGQAGPQGFDGSRGRDLSNRRVPPAAQPRDPAGGPRGEIPLGPALDRVCLPIPPADGRVESLPSRNGADAARRRRGARGGVVGGGGGDY